MLHSKCQEKIVSFLNLQMVFKLNISTADKFNLHLRKTEKNFISLILTFIDYIILFSISCFYDFLSQYLNEHF